MKAKLITVLLVVFMVAGMLQGCTAIVSQAGAQPGSVQVIPDSAELAAESKAIDDANKAAYTEKLQKMEDEVDVQNLRNAWEHIPYPEAVAWADEVAQKYAVESVDVQAMAAAAPEALPESQNLSDSWGHSTYGKSDEVARNNAVESAVDLYRAGEIADYSVQDLAAVAPDAQLEAYQRQYEADVQDLRNAWDHIPYPEAVAWADEVAQKYGVESADVQAIAAAAPEAQLEAYQRRYEVEMQKQRDAHKDMTYSEAVAMGDALGYMYEVAPVEGAVNAASEALASAAASTQRTALEAAADRQDRIEALKVNEFMLHDAIEKAAASYPSAGQGDQIEAANIRHQAEVENAMQLQRAGEREGYLPAGNGNQMDMSRASFEKKVEKAAASYPSAGQGNQLASSRLLLELEKSIEKAAGSYPSAGQGDQITISKERFGVEKIYPPRNGRGLCAK